MSNKNRSENENGDDGIRFAANSNSNAKEPIQEENDDDSLANNNSSNSLLMNKTFPNRRSARVIHTQSTSSDLRAEDMVPWVKSKPARAALLATVSSLYALVLVILALAFEVSTFVADQVVSFRFDPFYIYLYVVGLIFFAYCYAFLLRTKALKVDVPFTKSASKRQIFEDSNQPKISVPAFMSAKRKVTYSGHNAGSLYLRLGAIVFGIVGMIDKALTMYSAVDSGHVPDCYDGINIAEDMIAIIFIFVQLYFIFQNSKMAIHRFTEVGRFGAMHLIATNLCLWIRAVVTEEYHIINEIKELEKHEVEVGEHISIHNQSSITYRESTQHTHETNVSHESYSYFPLDCMHVHKEIEGVIRNAKPFMTTCVIEYALICAAVMYIMWRNVGITAQKRTKYRKQNFQIDCSSSTRGLFMGLLFVVFTIVSMIIFFTKVQLQKDYEALWVFHFTDCLLYIVSIFALGIAMFRIRTLYYMAHLNKGILLDDILLIVALVGQLMFCIFSIVALTKIDLTSSMIVVVSLCRMIEVLMQTTFILTAQRLVAITPQMQAEKPGRELITFLLLSNLAMFLINTFETQKAGSNQFTIDFYGKSIWTVIVHSTVPLNIFYRFHSSVCFAEIWKSTYRVKDIEAV